MKEPYATQKHDVSYNAEGRYATRAPLPPLVVDSVEMPEKKGSHDPLWVAIAFLGAIVFALVVIVVGNIILGG